MLEPKNSSRARSAPGLEVDAMRALDEEIAQVSAMIKSAPAASRSVEPLSPTLVRDPSPRNRSHFDKFCRPENSV